MRVVSSVIVALWALTIVEAATPQRARPQRRWFDTQEKKGSGAFSAQKRGAQKAAKRLLTPFSLHWLEFRGKPILPIGDSVTQGWMEGGANFDQRAYLDALAARGINVVLLWSYIGTSAEAQRQDPRVGYDAPEIWPWKGSPDEKNFDLAAFNPAYFKRLREFVQYADGKDVLVVITVQDGWTKTRFACHPFNAALGNGPLTDRRQFVELADHDGEMPVEYNPGWTRQQKNQHFQERFADRLAAELSDCGNVIFEMFNEGEWYDPAQRRLHEEHFLRFFRKRTAAPLMTNLDHIHSRDFEPRQNPAVDIISLHGKPWTGHFTRFEKQFNAEPARVVFESEPVPSFGATDVPPQEVVSLDTLRAAVWERALSGAGWVAQNDTSFGWDPKSAMAAQASLRDQAYDQIGHAARFFNQNGIEFWKMKPDSKLTSTGICLANPGQEYLVYLPEGGEVTVDLSAASGSLAAEWFNPRSGQATQGQNIPGGGTRSFKSPFDGDAVLHLDNEAGLPAPALDQVGVWQRWEHVLTSTRSYANPYAQVTLRVIYTGPAGHTVQTFGFWDGADTFRIRCAFSWPGTWRWETECSDADNWGLHRQSGTVQVLPYQGDNLLYQHGFLKVSGNRRYLTYGDDTPFLWMGDTAWAVPLRATDEEWAAYLADRRAKHFTLLQVAPASEWAGPSDRRGERAFTDKTYSQWNPAYWQSFEQKVQCANEAGLVVMLVGLMEPVQRYPEAEKACLFARNIVARLFGNFVIFSPSFDSVFMPLANDVGRAAREATSVHLITQHPGTPSPERTATYSMKYYDEPYLDFCGVQTGHNGGRIERCAHHAIEWILHAYRHEPHKPVINLEAMYDAQGQNGWRAIDARSLAWRTWLSGAMGYTYGAGDVPPKVPQGSGAVWKWVTDPQKYDYWKKALQWQSAFEMQYLHDFLAGIEWWRLEPAHDLVRNQPQDVTRRMVLAKSAAGDLAVAYLPNNETIEIDVSAFPAPLKGRWFDPVQGTYSPIADRIENKGTYRLMPPAQGDWVLLLEKVEE